MPKFTLVCDSHKTRETRVVIRASATDLISILCPVCKHPMARDIKPASSRILETLDSGLMSRRVERPADAERLFKERADADNKAKGF